jgi:hypothetical protein
LGSLSRSSRGRQLPLSLELDDQPRTTLGM